MSEAAKALKKAHSDLDVDKVLGLSNTATKNKIHP